jgi:hypothetical protein
MRCIRPLKATQNNDGDIVYDIKKGVQGLEPFQFDCRKCLPCRLRTAREKALRATHQAQMHDNNIFLTLTYDDEHLASNELIYRDFQLFMKRLRKHVWKDITKLEQFNNTKERKEIIKELKDAKKITYMVTGEYGDQTKRPHWHAILFNYRPSDAEIIYYNTRGEPLFASRTLTKLWPYGMHNFGEVTIDSAGYVARYAAKKLTHGKDGEHDYEPVHKISSRRAIGRDWIEKNWKFTFENGFCNLPNGQRTRIPRYYETWMKKHHPEKYWEYYFGVKQRNIKKMLKQEEKEWNEYLENQRRRIKDGKRIQPTRSTIKQRILNNKFKRLQENLKL